MKTNDPRREAPHAVPSSEAEETARRAEARAAHAEERLRLSEALTTRLHERLERLENRLRDHEQATAEVTGKLLGELGQNGAQLKLLTGRRVLLATLLTLAPMTRDLAIAALRWLGFHV